MKRSSAQIKISIPEGIYQNSEAEAQRIGISVQDFIRMLLATYFARSEKIAHLVSETKLLSNAQKEVQSGQVSEFDTTEALTKRLLEL